MLNHRKLCGISVTLSVIMLQSCKTRSFNTAGGDSKVESTTTDGAQSDFLVCHQPASLFNAQNGVIKSLAVGTKLVDQRSSK